MKPADMYFFPAVKWSNRTDVVMDAYEDLCARVEGGVG